MGCQILCNALVGGLLERLTTLVAMSYHERCPPTRVPSRRCHATVSHDPGTWLARVHTQRKNTGGQATVGVRHSAR